MTSLVEGYIRETAEKILAAARLHQDLEDESVLRLDLESAIKGALSAPSEVASPKVAEAPVLLREEPQDTTSPSTPSVTPSPAPRSERRAYGRPTSTRRAAPAPKPTKARPRTRPIAGEQGALELRAPTRQQPPRKKTVAKSPRKVEPLRVPKNVIPEPKGAPVPVWQSVTPTYIVCLEDGEKVENLRQHLKKAHGMSVEAYRTKWGLPDGYPMVAPNYRRVGPKLKDWLKQNPDQSLATTAVKGRA